MKNFFKITGAALLFVLMTACTTASTVMTPKVAALLQSSEFTFMAERANPSNYDVVRVMNSLPGTSSAQMLTLDYGYNLQLKNDQVKAELPYFGKAYTTDMNPEKNSYRFTSKDFTKEKTTGKNGQTVYHIITRDQQNSVRMTLEVFGNGKANLTMDSPDRQMISYQGYITDNLKSKK